MGILFSLIKSIASVAVSDKVMEQLNNNPTKAGKVGVILKNTLKSGFKSIFYILVGLIIANQVFDLNIDFNKVLHQIDQVIKYIPLEGF